MKNKFLILLLLIFPVYMFSQEVITELYTNPVIKTINFKNRLKTTKDNMLTLPFVDDFSGTDIFPSDSLWANKNVFVNSSYPVFPVTVAVATFDALNDTGALYQDASAYGFIADSLTSNPIRLDSVYENGNLEPLLVSDSVYFSFCYQPQGIGNSPETEDSLVLEFYSPDTSNTNNKWHHIWSSEGLNLQQFHNKYNVWFKYVMLPVTDSVKFFKKGFRFRFYNYASLANNSQPSWAGNVDQWHIDYVYLDKLRSKADTFYKDIAFIESAPSVLKNYSSMPWSQFNVNPAAEIKDTFNIVISNLDTDTFNYSYKYEIQDINGVWNYLHNGGNYNIYPYYLYGYQDYLPHAKPLVDFSLPLLSSDSAAFRIKHIIKEGMQGDDNRHNDTITYIQKFNNYYAYDDGVPEAGYGLTPANSMLAYKFTLNHPDTLRAVRMFFNQTYNNASQQFFYLTIWDDANNKPNNIIYKKSGYKPYYEDSLNKYYNYRIDDTTMVLSGTFYIGWKQVTSDNLNIGFDRKNNVQDKIFYNVGNGWVNTSYQGALMIRPVFGKKLPLVADINEIAENTDDIKVFPNPSDGENISIVFPHTDHSDYLKYTVKLFDTKGSLLFSFPYSEKINFNYLQNGIYLLCIDNNKTKRFVKLVIVK